MGLQYEPASEPLHVFEVGWTRASNTSPRQVVDKIHDAALDSLHPGGGGKVLDFTYEEIMQVLHSPLHLPETYTPTPSADIP